MGRTSWAKRRDAQPATTVGLALNRLAWERCTTMALTCASRIDRVVVHARGAVISRVVDLPADMPECAVDLAIPGITLLAEPGTLRATCSDRPVVFARMSIALPPSEDAPGPNADRVHAVSARIARLESHGRVLRARRDRLAEAPLDAGLSIRTHAARGKVRVSESLAAAELMRRWLEDCDDRLLDLAEQLKELARERDVAALAERQSRSADRMGPVRPTLCAHVRLDAGPVVHGLRVEYVVMPARWWPVYTLRAAGRLDRASWAVEALVAQLTGEDWAGAQLAFSTADLVCDARLPELASMRLGRAQAPSKGGYRPAPVGLEQMFAGYDKGMPSRPSSAPPPPPQDDSSALDEASSPEARKKAEGKRMKGFGSRPAPPVLGPPAVAPGAMPPVAMSPVAVATRAAASPQRTDGVMGLVQPEPVGAPVAPAFDKPAPAPPVEPEIEPADGWLDFDSLRLVGPEDTLARGRLRRDATGEYEAERRAAARRIEAMQPAGATRDPRETRGLFDARYLAEGAGMVASDGQTHRVRIGSADAAAEVRYRTVPREAAAVYRELRVKNPFPFPLLDGPVDVYVDGSAAASAELARLDIGGVARLGLGVEERLRVARNVRVEEGTTGLLGGSTAVDHTVAIDMVSSIGASATVEVIDRMPDTDDKEVEIKLLAAHPPAGRYTQAELGRPVRGGLAWVVELPPAGRTTVEFRYRISFSSKCELVGGNRRD